MRVRRISVALGLVGVLVAAPVSHAVRDEEIPVYSDAEFVALIDAAVSELPGLTPPITQGSITGNSSLDERIWKAAFGRGYRLRHVAIESNLVWHGGLRMQPLASEAWSELKAAALDAGHRLWVKSAYRSASDQRSIFTARLSGTSARSIDSTLAYHSLPGTSRHHSGYTIDVTLPGRELWQFRGTAAHAWLTAENYANAKRFGFVPSYPPDSPPQGPNPEPWEFVFVGAARIMGHDVVMGDWDGDGLKTQGVFADGEWQLGEDNDAVTFRLGTHGDVPLVGDWNRDGIDTPAVFDGSSIEFLEPASTFPVDPDFVGGENGSPWLHWSRGGWSYVSMSPDSGMVEIQYLYGLGSGS